MSIDTRDREPVGAPGRRGHAFPRPADQRTAPQARLLDLLTELEDMRSRVRSAERKADALEHGLLSNRRIGMAVGILMTRRQLTEDQAFAMLSHASQHGNVKLRDLARHVIETGEIPAHQS